ncbi:MAG: twin-arginine translocase subunit TatC, partial [Bacteroidota bacterium]
RKYRRHSFVGILILASVLTPPDVVTQILIALPLYILYELSVFVAKRAQKAYEADLS